MVEIVLVHFRRMRAKSFELNHDFTYEYRCLQRTVIKCYRPIYVVLPVAPFVLLASWWAQRTNHFVLLCCAICADHFWYHTQFPCLTHLCFFSRLVFRVDQAFPEAEANFNLPVLSIARHTPLLLRFDSRSYASINSKLQHLPPGNPPAFEILKIESFKFILRIPPGRKLRSNAPSKHNFSLNDSLSF